MAGEVLFEQTSPYGSRAVAVEREGDTVFAYLLDTTGEPGIIVCLWLLNLAAAPGDIDVVRMQDGLAPMMPAADTKHPDGSRCPTDWRVVWFEEGDGLGVYGDVDLLGVIPGWAGERGFHGFASEARSVTPLAWPLDDARDTFDLRLDGANRFWGWRSEDASWRSIQSGILDHLVDRVGDAEQYWQVDDGAYPPVGASRHAWREVPGVAITATVGMSGQPMPGVERYHDEPSEWSSIELAVATVGDDDAGARLLSSLATFPWQRCTWLGEGHTLGSQHPSLTELGYAGILFTTDPLDGAIGPTPPDLVGVVTETGAPVRFRWLVPLRRDELELAQREGTPNLRAHLRSEGRSWVLA